MRAAIWLRGLATTNIRDSGGSSPEACYWAQLTRLSALAQVFIGRAH